MRDHSEHVRTGKRIWRSDRFVSDWRRLNVELGSISAALSSLVHVPPREERVRGRSAGSFPEQRLVIEPNVEPAIQIDQSEGQ